MILYSSYQLVCWGDCSLHVEQHGDHFIHWYGMILKQTRNPFFNLGFLRISQKIQTQRTMSPMNYFSYLNKQIGRFFTIGYNEPLENQSLCEKSCLNFFNLEKNKIKPYGTNWKSFRYEECYCIGEILLIDKVPEPVVLKNFEYDDEYYCGFVG